MTTADKIISILQQNASSIKPMKAKNFSYYNINARTVSAAAREVNQTHDDIYICSSKDGKNGGFWIAENKEQIRQDLERHKTDAYTILNTVREIEKKVDR